jgi:hypothetical protein
MAGIFFLPAASAAAGFLRTVERYGMLILLVLVFTGVTGRIVRPVMDWAAKILIAIARSIV